MNFFASADYFLMTRGLFERGQIHSFEKKRAFSGLFLLKTTTPP